MTIETTINGKTHKAQFIRSEEAGYRPGSLHLDLPNGDKYTIRRNGDKSFCLTLVRNHVATWNRSFKTKKEACIYAAEHFAACELDVAAFTE